MKRQKQRNRRRFAADFKARVALEAAQEKESLSQIAQRTGVHPVVVGQWKRQLVENASAVFETPGGGSTRALEQEREELLKKIGELTVERDFLARGLQRSK
jgi:transposase-like protein